MDARTRDQVVADMREREPLFMLEIRRALAKPNAQEAARRARAALHAYDRDCAALRLELGTLDGFAICMGCGEATHASNGCFTCGFGQRPDRMPSEA